MTVNIEAGLIYSPVKPRGNKVTYLTFKCAQLHKTSTGIALLTLISYLYKRVTALTQTPPKSFSLFRSTALAFRHVFRTIWWVCESDNQTLIIISYSYCCARIHWRSWRGLGKTDVLNVEDYFWLGTFYSNNMFLNRFAGTNDRIRSNISKRLKI